MKKVIKSHRPDISIVFQTEKGEIVTCIEKPTRWEGWLYCEKKDGISAWVSKAFVTPVKNSSEEYQFMRAYNAFEISVSTGEFVKIIEIESGWAKIEKDNGKIGWIPVENLELYP